MKYVYSECCTFIVSSGVVVARLRMCYQGEVLDIRSKHVAFHFSFEYWISIVEFIFVFKKHPSSNHELVSVSKITLSRQLKNLIREMDGLKPS